MKRNVSPVMVAAVIAGALVLAGFFFYRTVIAPPSYPGAIKFRPGQTHAVQTPYGLMTPEQAARAGLSPVNSPLSNPIPVAGR